MDFEAMAEDVLDPALKVALRSAGQSHSAWGSDLGAELPTRIAGWHSNEIDEADRRVLLDRHRCLAVVKWKVEGNGRKVVRFCPVVERDAPEVCYHATPYYGLIEEGGWLRNGGSVAKSTTGYPGASHFIHVSLAVADAHAWAIEHLQPCMLNGRFRIIEIATARLGCAMFRDPCSQTGWLLSVQEVAKEYLRLL